MIKKHSFANPFPTFRQKFGKNGRSNSAPGAFDVINDRYGIAVLNYIHCTRQIYLSLLSICSKTEVALKLPSLSEDSTEETQPPAS